MNERAIISAIILSGMTTNDRYDHVSRDALIRDAILQADLLLAKLEVIHVHTGNVDHN